MIDRKAQMIEDRYLRDSARALFDADIQNVKADLAHKSVGTRFVDRAREGAIDIYEEAVDMADDHKGALAAVIAAVGVWFARHPIMQALGIGEDEAEDPTFQQRMKERFGR